MGSPEQLGSPRSNLKKWTNMTKKEKYYIRKYALNTKESKKKE